MLEIKFNASFLFMRKLQISLLHRTTFLPRNFNKIKSFMNKPALYYFEIWHLKCLRIIIFNENKHVYYLKIKFNFIFKPTEVTKRKQRILLSALSVFLILLIRSRSYHNFGFISLYPLNTSSVYVGFSDGKSQLFS